MPRPSAIQAASEPSARQRVLDAATQLFTQKGYAAATVREIVEAAGVTKPILYYYFGNKAGVYLEIVQGIAGAIDLFVNQVQQYEGGIPARILRYGREFRQGMAQHLEVSRLIYAMFYGPPQGAPYFDYNSLHGRLESCLLGLVKKGIRQGEFPCQNAGRLARTLMAVISYVSEAQLIECEELKGVDLDKELIEMLEIILARARVSKEQPGRQSRKLRARKAIAKRRA